MKNIDLHNHSRVSDGLLAPAELVRLAAGNGVTTLALTDHDDTDGLEEAAQEALALGLRFINGVEVSVTWAQHTIHVVGLNIDPGDATLLEGLATIRSGRMERAEKIAQELAKAGIPGALEGALRHAHNPKIVARPHFARYLVEQGLARDVPSVFKRFLVQGKTGYVKHRWAELGDAVAWVRSAGGIPVLAHPGRYSLNHSTMDRLIDEFVEAGGLGIEVVTSNHTRDQAEAFAAQATRRGLLASRGSDYHGPGESRLEPGKLPPLPPQCVPVWQAWGDVALH
ncbi:MAG: PHP domain-containing protein [Betaproteobacteria bacterium]|nr:PHP domain-containing protein [Betaproteobacteria bacterium]